jgi:hypothetical protein
VDRHARVNDLVLIDGGRGAVAAFDHYIKRTGFDSRAKNTGSFKGDAVQITETYARIWDVTQVSARRSLPVGGREHPVVGRENLL